MRKLENSYKVNSNRRHIDTWSHMGRSNPLFLNHSVKSYKKQILLCRSNPLFVNHSLKSYQTQILLGWSNPLFPNHSLEHFQMLHFTLDILMCLNSIILVTSFGSLDWFSYESWWIVGYPKARVIKRKIRKIKIMNENNLGK